MLPLGATQPEGPVPVVSCLPQHRPICQLPPPTGGPQEPHQEWGPKLGDQAQEGLALPKLTSPVCLQTEPGSVKVVQERFLREPGRGGGEAMDPRTLGLTHQHASDMPGAPILPESPRAATHQALGTEPEDTEGSHHGSELLERQLWGELHQEGPPLKGLQGKERLGHKDVDEDRDIDESLPQESLPSQVSPSLQSSPTQGRPPPQIVSRAATGTPGFLDEGASPLPVNFLSKVSAETQVSEPDRPSAGHPHVPPEFVFHVDIKANVQKEQGRSEVDLERTALPGAPGEEQEPQGPAEGENTKKTDLPEPSGKRPAAGLPGKPVSRVPQLKGLCLEGLCPSLLPGDLMCHPGCGHCH